MSAWSAYPRLLIACLLAAVLVACSHPPDEVQVRAAIDAGANAVRSSDPGDLSDVLSKAFDGNDGLLDRRTAVNMVRVARLRRESVKVVMGPVSLERRGDRFVATFTVTLAGGQSWLPSDLGVYHVSSGWRNEDGHWRCYVATWKPALH